MTTNEATGRVVTVTIDGVPPSLLFPNNARTVSYHATSDASAPLRDAAKWRGIEAALPIRSVNGGVIFAGPVTVRVLVMWPKGRRCPDIDALALATKAHVDGLTDAGIWRDDSQIVEMCYRQSKTATGDGYVEFEIREAGALWAMTIEPGIIAGATAAEDDR